MKPKSILNRSPKPSCTYCKAVRGCFLKKHIIWAISVTARKFAPKKASYYGRVVQALDLRSNGQVSSWVQTPVVATFFENCCGEWVCHRKQTNDSFEIIKTVKWFNELWFSPDHNPLGFNEELKASASRLRISHWKNKHVPMGTNPSVSISFRKRTCKLKLPPNETEVYFESFTKTQLYLL